MERRSRPDSLEQTGISDSATLFLCRQGQRWVVVIESPSVTGAVSFRFTGRDVNDARFELLSCARRACPDAAIMSTDGALERADYEWRLEVRGIELHAGDLGVALHHALAPESDSPASSASSNAMQQPTRATVGRRCHWGMSPPVSGRPRRF
jgi:hypothetical protein